VKTQRPIRLLEVGLAGPPETYLVWKLEGLAERGFEVVVASPAARSRHWSQLRGVRLVPVPRWDEPRLRRAVGGLWDGSLLALGDLKRSRRLLRSLAAQRGRNGRGSLTGLVGGMRDFARLARLAPDVVHFEWETAAIRHLPLFDVWRCPVVVSCHGAGINVYPVSRREARLVAGLREIFERADAVHCVSEALAVEASRYGLDRAKVALIRPAVDPAFFSPSAPRTVDAETFQIVGAGLLRWLKGWEYGLEAVARAVERGVPVHLDLLGDDPDPTVGEEGESERLLHTVADLSLDGRVRLHGAVSSRAVRDALRSADVLLHPSLSEGIPTVVLEAMACGVPVVVTDCGGVREAVREGVDGFVVPPRDPEALANALAALWADPRLRERMGAAGRERVSSSFTLRSQLDEYAGLYQRLLAGPAGQ
jgi:colanic acid/amylovoran biosynthesis glycosyltransferase